MKYRQLGRSGLQVSEISLGSWLTLGSAMDQDTSERCVRVALDLGINLLDTADVYAQGAAETALGLALQTVPRKDYVLASKCYFPTGEGPNDRGLSRKHVFESLHASLTRLRTDYLDLYQCHRYDEGTPLEETIQVMDDLCGQGKILYWGVSCWTAEQIGRTRELCAREGWTVPISNQPPYNLFERGIEADVAPACERAGLGLLVYSPLAQGVLTGKYASSDEPPPESRAADPQRNRFIGRYMGREHLEATRRLGEIADRLGVSLPALALAWCLRLNAVASVIVGVSQPEQLDQNLEALSVELPPEVRLEIDELLAELPPVRH